jgi:hypothetical protein
MEQVNDLKAKIKTIKKNIKEWEYEFAEKTGRKPTKDDIALNEEVSNF